MEKKISYLNRNFSDYRNSLISFSKEYYPDLTDTFNDASVGSWIIDVAAAVSDNLSYLADRVFQETSVNSAQQMSSLMNLARSKGLKVPGPKASVAEVELTCILPTTAGTNSNDSSTTREPRWDYAPLLRKGMQFSAGNQVFELMDDVNFAHQSDNNGYSDRTINVNRNSNGSIVSYTIGKRALVVSGKSKVYRRVIRATDIIPFMEFVIPDRDVMEVDSIIFKDGTDYMSDPDISEFEFTEEFTPAENNKIGKRDVWRYFEVDSLSDQTRWGDVLQSDGNPTVYEYRYNNDNEGPHYFLTKGEWKPLKQKFITEFTDNGYLKVIFGAGLPIGQNVELSNASTFGRYQISKLINNDSLGVLPRQDMTMYIRYRVGGGSASNVAEGAINTIVFYDMQFGCEGSGKIDPQIVEAVKKTLTVYNVTPSVSGKDMPSEAEVRNLIKYSNGAQKRCVTVKDYYERILKLPPKYGTPFRVGVLEENNKIKINTLGLDSERHLSPVLPDVLARNIMEYLKEFKMITDYVEIRPGKIYNISVEADIYIDKNYNKPNTIKQVIDTIYDYLDIEKHQMGEDIYVSDIIKEVMKVDGVINLFDMRIYNEYNGMYSLSQAPLPKYTEIACDGPDTDSEEEDDRFRIDIDALDGILYCDSESMFEVKFKDKDIRIRARER